MEAFLRTSSNSRRYINLATIGRAPLRPFFPNLWTFPNCTNGKAHIIRQIENGLADWTHDFSEVETPLPIKYVKIEQRGKQSEQKKIAKKDENVFYCPFYQRKKCSQSNCHYGKIKGIDRYLQHICATCNRKEGKIMYHPECSEMCPLQRA